MGSLDKKVLLISHNPLSRVNNNGKTLVSIFKGLPENNIYQIYLKRHQVFVTTIKQLATGL